MIIHRHNHYHNQTMFNNIYFVNIDKREAIARLQYNNTKWWVILGFEINPGPMGQDSCKTYECTPHGI